MKPYRVEVRYPPPQDRMLQVIEFDTEEDAITYGNRMLLLARRMREAGYPASREGGQVSIFSVEHFKADRPGSFAQAEWIELTPVEDWQTEDKDDGEEAPPVSAPRPWRR